MWNEASCSEFQFLACNGSTSDRAGRRLSYQKRAGRWVHDVIVDIAADGRQDWGERFPGELRWYAYTPSPAERTMVGRWQKTGQTPVEALFER